MVRRPRRTIFLAMLIGALLLPGGGDATQGAGASRDIQRWQSRLEALRPEQPLGYLELAEEIADAAADDAELALARRLFGLAGLLDPYRLGRSACLALADLEPGEQDTRRLLALAALLSGGPIWLAVDQDAEPAATAVVAVADTLSHFRQGHGSRAQAALRRPGARELLLDHEHILRGGIKRFDEDCKLYRNQRRPSQSEAELTRLLRFEAALLAGPDRSWSGELLLGAGRPLIEVDPDRLQDAFGLDASRPLYRNGRWVPSPP